MNIAILNLSKDDELNYTLDCLEDIDNEIIDAKIDLFVNKNTSVHINNKFINKIIYLDTDDFNIFNFKNKFDALKYYNKNKYNIAIDTQGSLKSAFLNYQLTGKTSGFVFNNLQGKLISSFYDEKTPIKSKIEKKDKTHELIKNTFGF